MVAASFARALARPPISMKETHAKMMAYYGEKMQYNVVLYSRW